ncbi:hypothetical protein B0H14DRAFT_2557554 [Mycena olivaceomarginata]|nr:hypothetical protein B0H14DRAFT_2557554 [Mycena olivaceomarginata]
MPGVVVADAADVEGPPVVLGATIGKLDVVLVGGAATVGVVWRVEVVAVVLVVVVVGDPLPPPPPPPPFTYSRPPPCMDRLSTPHGFWWSPGHLLDRTAAVPTAALAPLTGLAGGEESVDE